MKSVLLFPGQGSQSVGMMNGFDSNVIKEVFDMGSDIFGEAGVCVHRHQQPIDGFASCISSHYRAC